MERLDGTGLARAIRDKVAARVALKPAVPKLAVLLVGDDPASHLYVRLKRQACEEAGVRFELFSYPSSASEVDLVRDIQGFNDDPSVTGILVQLPLPTQDADSVIAAIDPKKDVDGFHPENLRLLKEGKPGIVSALALGIMKLIEAAGAPGEKALVIGSDKFAEPLVPLLADRGVNTQTADPADSDLASRAAEADILIVAVGRPGFVTADMVKDGATVIDVGTTKVDGRLLGDVDAASLEKKPGHLTPVPGGVGPLTVAMLLVNILKARELQR